MTVLDGQGGPSYSSKEDLQLLGWALTSWPSHSLSPTPILIIQVILCLKSSSQESHLLILQVRPPRSVFLSQPSGLSNLLAWHQWMLNKDLPNGEKNNNKSHPSLLLDTSLLRKVNASRLHLSFAF